MTKDEQIAALRAALDDMLSRLRAEFTHPEIDCPICPAILIGEATLAPTEPSEPEAGR